MRVFACTLTLGIFLALPVALAQESACIFAANQAAVVNIQYSYSTSDGNGTETGTGFIISPSGHVLTNAHVVTPRDPDVQVHSAKIIARPGSLFNPEVEATVLVRDRLTDLALLKLPQRDGDLEWPTVDIGRPGSKPVGSWLMALGFASSDLAIIPPGIKTAHNTIVDGELRTWWQTSLSLNSGNSGSPVFDALGTIVGVAVAIRREAQLITYVIPISQAQHLLDAAGVQPALAGRCAVFPECRHESHGIEYYEVDEFHNRWGEWRRGGYNRGAFCNDLLSDLRKIHPEGIFTFVRDDERSRELPIRRFEYRYFCEFRRLENPVYNLKRSVFCLSQ